MWFQPTKMNEKYVLVKSDHFPRSGWKKHVPNKMTSPDLGILYFSGFVSWLWNLHHLSPPSHFQRKIPLGPSPGRLYLTGQWVSLSSLKWSWNAAGRYITPIIPLFHLLVTWGRRGLTNKWLITRWCSCILTIWKRKCDHFPDCKLMRVYGSKTNMHLFTTWKQKHTASSKKIAINETTKK